MLLQQRDFPTDRFKSLMTDVIDRFLSFSRFCAEKTFENSGVFLASMSDLAEAMCFQNNLSVPEDSIHVE